MLDQIFFFSKKVKFAAGLNNDTSHPPPFPHSFSYLMNELTNKRVPCYQTKWTKIFPCHKINGYSTSIYTYYFY